MPPSLKPCDCLFLTGATASGKTAVGVALARRLGAEIVSLDSMAIYRGMDIGTAKPTPEEQGGIAHHLIDVASPSDEFSVANYVEAAERVVAEIAGRGREAMFVGGTPLYLKALLRGIDAGPPANWPLRARLVEWGREAGPGALHQRLAAVDPAAAARLHPSDTRRLVRALEVLSRPAARSAASSSILPKAARPRSVACLCSIGRAISFTSGSTAASTRCSPPACSTNAVRKRCQTPFGARAARLRKRSAITKRSKCWPAG